MKYPAQYNFPDIYQGDGIEPFSIRLKYPSGETIPLNGMAARMQLKNVQSMIAFDFSTAEGADALLTITEAGAIQFPNIKSMKLEPGIYYYDLQVTDANDFVRTYLRGIWKVNQDITK